jgi:hypothetical protein
MLAKSDVATYVIFVYKIILYLVNEYHEAANRRRSSKKGFEKLPLPLVSL